MYSRILVPMDGSAPAECGLREAISIAAAMRATIVVLNVFNDIPLIMGSAGYVNYGELSDLMRQGGREIVAKAAETAKAANVPCETLVVEVDGGPASDAIVEQAAQQHCDLIVMGTHGRRGIKRLTLGSDAELVVRHAAVPVMLVRAPAA